MKNALIVYLLVFTCSLSAQHQLGLTLDNYQGINGALLNPAAPVSGPLSWDLNVIGGYHFSEQNYGYISDIGLLGLARDAASHDFYFQRAINEGEIDMTNSGPYYTFDYYRGSRKRFGITSNALIGPSFFVRLGQNTTVGFVSRGRVHGSAFNVDTDLSFYSYDNRPFGEVFPLSPVRTGAAIWAEYGLNLGQRIDLNDGALSIGATVKALRPYEALYFNSNSTVDYAKQPDNVITGVGIDLQAGYTNGWAEPDYRPQVMGNGWGLDLGFTYTAFAENGPYRWKASAAVLDIGQLNFTDKAQDLRFVNPNLADLTGDDYQGYNDRQQADSLVQQFARDVLENPDGALQADQFSLGLPTTLSLQFDYAVTSTFYVAAAYSGSLAFAKNRMERGDMLAVVPRWEKRWFSFSLPVSVYEWQRVKVGAAARLGFLTLGSDKLTSLVQSQEFTGTDFYFALKLTPLWGQGNKRDRGPRVRGRKANGKQVPCYKW